MGIKDILLNILFPPRCVSCKREGVFICPDCMDKLKQRRIHAGSYKSECEFKYLDGVIYAFDYALNPTIHNAIHNFKYKYNEDLKIYFGLFISKKLSELSMIKGKKIILIPVPLHPKRLNERGFNQAELIACEIQKNLGDRIEVLHLLKRARYTSQQAKLNKKERHENLKDAFLLNKKFVQHFDEKKVYFIVDDVCTTGSTLENCAKTLKKAGIKKVYGLTIARAFK